MLEAVAALALATARQPTIGAASRPRRRGLLSGLGIARGMRRCHDRGDSRLRRRRCLRGSDLCSLLRGGGGFGLLLGCGFGGLLRGERVGGRLLRGSDSVQPRLRGRRSRRSSCSNCWG
jgi:hypothetical protein